VLKLRVVNEEMRFEIVPHSGENTSQVVALTFNAKGAWHRVEIDYKEQMLYVDIDYKFIRRHDLGAIEFGDRVMLASSTRRNTGTNYIICLKMVCWKINQGGLARFFSAQVEPACIFNKT
jgi:hypothetical protein